MKHRFTSIRITKDTVWLIWRHGIYGIEVPISRLAFQKCPDIVRTWEALYLPCAIEVFKKHLKEYEGNFSKQFADSSFRENSD